VTTWRLDQLARALTLAMRATSPGDSPGAAPQRQHEAAKIIMLPTAAYSGWDAIYSDNVGRIYGLMYSKVGNRADAEDLTSQVFLDALRPLKTTASAGEVRAYLLATARTVLARHWRRTFGHQITVIDLNEVDLEDFNGSAQTERPGEASDRTTRILSGLPERYRSILTLRFLHGYTIKQAAVELGVSVANAKVLQHRALRQAAGLDKEGETS
jgi:RNA polymerase sigma-70 factor, ECF subfamily